MHRGWKPDLKGVLKMQNNLNLRTKYELLPNKIRRVIRTSTTPGVERNTLIEAHYDYQIIMGRLRATAELLK